MIMLALKITNENNCKGVTKMVSPNFLKLFNLKALEDINIFLRFHCVYLIYNITFQIYKLLQFDIYIYIHTYIHTYIHIILIIFHIDYYKILNIVPCVIQ